MMDRTQSLPALAPSCRVSARPLPRSVGRGWSTFSESATTGQFNEGAHRVRRGSGTEAVTSGQPLVSFFRWAMEIMAIDEYSLYMDVHRNDVVMLFKGIGVCKMDTVLTATGDGSGRLTPDEAINFVEVQQNFTFASCNKYVATAYGALLALGVGFRLLAFLVLRFSKKTQY